MGGSGAHARHAAGWRSVLKLAAGEMMGGRRWREGRDELSEVRDKFRTNARETVDIGYCYWLGHFT